MKWPVWIPYPSSWWRALYLTPLLPGASITAFWPLTIIFWNSEGSPSPILIPIIVMVMLLSMLLYAAGHHWLSVDKSSRSRYLKWLPHRQSFWEGFYAVLVLNLAILPGLLISLPHRSTLTSLQRQERDRIAVIIFVTSSAYLYQAEFIVRQRFFPKAIAKPKSASKPTPVDDIDVELNRLRGEMGLTRVKKRREPPTSL